MNTNRNLVITLNTTPRYPYLAEWTPVRDGHPSLQVLDAERKFYRLLNILLAKYVAEVPIVQVAASRL